jgi:uncharacterized protein YjbI with pentapeptide repeats
MFKFHKPKNTFDSVAKKLVKGLREGSIILQEPPLGKHSQRYHPERAVNSDTRIITHEADLQHYALLKQEVDVWNNWRKENPALVPNLSGADLRGARLRRVNLSGADLREANLSGADLEGANLREARLIEANLHSADLRGAYLEGAELFKAILYRANLSGAYLNSANLSGADFRGANLLVAHLNEANLSGADFRGAYLEGADLSGAYLSGADFRGADLSKVSLREATLVQTDFSKANLDGCYIYGISAWGVNLEGAIQSNLVITPLIEPPRITVDNLEVAQFVYLLLHNEKIRDVINTIGKKAVLILGQFTERERKRVLDAIRDELRKRGYLPIVFEFERPVQRDFTETVMTLAGMCLFIIADISKPRSVPLELQAIVPDYMIPFVPIIEKGEQPFSMFQDLWQKYDWVLDPRGYSSVTELVDFLDQAVIEPAKRRRDELEAKKAKALIIQDIKDF